MFENSLRLVEDCGLTWLHVFPYSARVGTPAARMPQMDRGIIKERAARLRALGNKRVSDHLMSRLGHVHNILIENENMGRTEGFTEVSFTNPQPVGQIVQARIKGCSDTQLIV